MYDAVNSMLSLSSDVWYLHNVNFNQPSRPQALKMVSESRFCVEFKNPFLSCRTGGFRASERGFYPNPTFF